MPHDDIDPEPDTSLVWYCCRCHHGPLQVDIYSNTCFNPSCNEAPYGHQRCESCRININTLKHKHVSRHRPSQIPSTSRESTQKGTDLPTDPGLFSELIARSILASSLNLHSRNWDANRWSQTLPDLLHVFALDLRWYSNSPEEEEIAAFTEQNKNRIADAFITISDRLKQQDVSCNHQQNLEQVLQPDMKAMFDLITGSIAFKRLISQVKARLQLDYTTAHSLRDICTEFISTADWSYPSLSRDNQYQLERPQSKVLILCNWSPNEFIKVQKYKEGPGRLAKALTITGSANACQLTSYSEYVRQVWPLCGKDVVDAILDEGRDEWREKTVFGYEILGNNEKIKIKSKSKSLTLVECIGCPGTFLEILEILAWTGTALRQASTPKGVECWKPQLKALGPTEGFYRFRLEFERLPPIDGDNDSVGNCWHGLFKNPVIASGFPIPFRQNGANGLELSLEAMGALIGAPKVTMFQQTAVLKGFNAAIVPVALAEDHVKWHIYINTDGSRMPYSDPRIQSHSDIPPDHPRLQSLETERHILGWTPRISYNIGSPSAKYDIGWSSPDFVGPGCTLEKVAISGSTGFFSIQATLALGQRDKSPTIKRGVDAYLNFGTLNSFASSYVVFYDVSEKRAWLSNAMHTLLHLVRASLEYDSTANRPFTGEYLSPCLEEDTDPTDPEAAIRFFCNRNNLEKPLYRNLDTVQTVRETKTTNRLERPYPETSTTEHLTSTYMSAQDLPLSCPETSTTEHRTSSYMLLQDRIQEIVYVLEQIIDHQANIHASAAPGIPLKVNPHEVLEGYRFMDLATSRAPKARMVKLSTYTGTGKSWVDFTRAISAVTLFGEGFGELLSLPDQPATLDAKVCADWRSLPIGKDYLAVSTYDLSRILNEQGSSAEFPLMKLAPGIHWKMPQSVFETCACLKPPGGLLGHSIRGFKWSCDRVQAISPPPSSFLSRPGHQRDGKQKHPESEQRIGTQGAVVFGNGVILPVKWDLKKEKSPKGAYDCASPLPDAAGQTTTTSATTTVLDDLVDSASMLSASDTPLTHFSTPCPSPTMGNTSSLSGIAKSGTGTPQSSSTSSTPPIHDINTSITTNKYIRRTRRIQEREKLRK